MVLIHRKKSLTAEEEAAQKLKEEEQRLGIQDEYQAKGFELVSWVQKHKGLVLGLIVALFLGGAALAGYTYYKQRVEESATNAYIEALQPVESLSAQEESKEKWLEAQKKLEAVVAKYPSSGAALLAHIYAGHIALDNNNAAKAEELYNAALKKVSEKDELYPLVLLGLAYAEENNNKPKEALAHFTRITELKGNVGKDVALFEAARLAKDGNEIDRAKGYLNKLLEEFPNSMFDKDAKRLKDSL